MYNLSIVGKMVGVSRKTVFNWIEHESLKHLFSEEAKDDGNRLLNENDLFIINTINFLRENGTREWDEIAEKIETGYRITDLSIAASEVDTGLTPAELFAKTLAITQERDLVMQQRDQALAKMEELHDLYKEELKEQRARIEERFDDIIERQQEQIAKLNREIGRLEGKLMEQSNDDID